MVYSLLCSPVCACRDVTLQVLSLLLALLLFQCMAVLELWCCVSGTKDSLATQIKIKNITVREKVIHFSKHPIFGLDSMLNSGEIVNQNIG